MDGSRKAKIDMEHYLLGMDSMMGPGPLQRLDALEKQMSETPQMRLGLMKQFKGDVEGALVRHRSLNTQRVDATADTSGAGSCNTQFATHCHKYTPSPYSQPGRLNSRELASLIMATFSICCLCVLRASACSSNVLKLSTGTCSYLRGRP